MHLYSSLAILNLSIKNKRSFAKLPYSRKVNELVKVLKNIGILHTYTLENNIIIVYFKYVDNNSVFNGFYFYSKSSFNYSVGLSELRRDYYKKNKLFILSTIDGICTSKEAILKHHGGIILAEIKK